MTDTQPEEIEPPKCNSRRAHGPHDYKSPDDGHQYCKGFDPTKADPVADVISGRGLGRLFERAEKAKG